MREEPSANVSLKKNGFWGLLNAIVDRAVAYRYHEVNNIRINMDKIFGCTTRNYLVDRCPDVVFETNTLYASIVNRLKTETAFARLRKFDRCH